MAGPLTVCLIWLVWSLALGVVFAVADLVESGREARSREQKRDAIFWSSAG